MLLCPAKNSKEGSGASEFFMSLHAFGAGVKADVYRSRPPLPPSDVEMRAFLALGSLAVAKADLIGNYGPRIPDHGPHVVIDEGARGLFFW